MKTVEAVGTIDVSSARPVAPDRPRQSSPVSSPEAVASAKTGRGPEKTDNQDALEKEGVKKIADRLNRMGHIFNRKIRFEVPMDSRDVIVKIIDKETGQVIRQIPPPELVKLATRMEEIYGMIFKGNSG
jgi:flagellar protein FlaG